jgi:iron complex transport system substrate-binding protein
MGRSVDQRHWLGLRTDRDRWRRGHPAEATLSTAAKDRIILPDVVRAAAPDVILASWCGKKVVPDRIRNRPGWSEIPAVRNDRIVEIKSALILQPGPAALTDGLDAMVAALWPVA